MVVYIKLEPEEEADIKRALMKTVSVSARFKDTGNRVAKLKKSKKYAARGLATAMKSIDEEIARIKEMLPELEKPREEKPKEVKVKIKKIKKKRAKPRKKKKIVKEAKGKKTKQQLELERLREQIYKL